VLVGGETQGVDLFVAEGEVETLAEEGCVGKGGSLVAGVGVGAQLNAEGADWVAAGVAVGGEGLGGVQGAGAGH
jgi:hypothetical protein